MMISRNLAVKLLPKSLVISLYRLSVRFPGLAAFFISVFLYFPPLWLYSGLDESSDRFGLMMQQARDPFSIRYDTIDNVLAYRLIVPLFNHVTGLRGNWISLPSIVGALGLCLLTARLFRGVASGKLVLVFVLLVAFSQIVVSGTSFWPGTDSLAIATVLGILFVRNRWVETLLVFLAISMDERSIVAILLLPLLLRASQNGEPASVRDHLSLFIRWLPGLVAAAAFRALIWSGIVFPPPVQNYQYNIIASGLISSSTFGPFALSYTVIQWIASLRWLWVFFAVLVVRFLYPFTGRDTLPSQRQRRLRRDDGLSPRVNGISAIPLGYFDRPARCSTGQVGSGLVSEVRGGVHSRLPPGTPAHPVPAA